MKKELLLFITCFFLFSSLTIFLTHRNTQLSEIIKNKGEKVKKLLKELENKKGKNNANQDEDHLDDLPWLLNWKGATFSLVVCALIAVPTGRILAKKIPGSCFKPDEKIFIIDVVLFIILFFIPFPFLLAIAKYKDKSYKERYCLLWRSYWKPFVCLVLNWLFFIILLFYNVPFKKDNNNNNNLGVDNEYQANQQFYDDLEDLHQDDNDIRDINEYQIQNQNDADNFIIIGENYF